MKMNRTLAYGMAALESLSQMGRGRDWVRVKELARAENLPVAYLNKVLKALEKAGMVESARGRGFRLARPLDRINVWEMMEAFTFNGAPVKPGPDASQMLYTTLRKQVSTWLEGLTLEDIVQSVKKKQEKDG
ncbi:MAG: Rrf2 family transcriptional regulator [Elusimicrobiota bacterium]